MLSAQLCCLLHLKSQDELDRLLFKDSLPKGFISRVSQIISPECPQVGFTLGTGE